MKTRLIALGLVAAMAGLASVSAQAQFAKPEDAIKYRKSTMFMLGQHWGRLGAMATGRAPFDAKAAADNADAVAALGKLALGAFPAGSDKGDTRAKAEIWGDAAKFKDAMDKSQTEITKVVAAAKAGNADALKAAFGPASGTCKGCHDNFRKD